MTTQQTTQHSDSSRAPSIQNHTTSHQGQSLSPVEVSTQKITRRYIRGSHPARVTRISIETPESHNGELCKPRLKRGARISNPETEEKKSLLITSAHQAISINHPGARAIIAKLDGQHSALEISCEIDAPIEIVEKVIEQLKIAQLLDVKTSKIKLHNRFQSPIAERAAHTEDQSNDASYKQLQARMSSELNQTTWIDGVVDGGVELLSARQSFGVEIHGENRLATLIYAALLASGVTHTKFSISSRRALNSIGDRDLGTGVLRITDFGLNFSSRIEELSREWALFPTASKNVKGSIATPIPERNLRVIVAEHSDELITQLMRDGHDHFLVGQSAGGAAYVGPMVFPGKSPCARCLALGKHERYGVQELIPISAEIADIPVALTYQIAGSAVQAILQLIDTGASDFTGAQLCFDYTSPMHGQPIRIARHPLCQCQWGSLKTSAKSTTHHRSDSTNEPRDTILF